MHCCPWWAAGWRSRRGHRRECSGIPPAPPRPARPGWLSLLPRVHRDALVLLVVGDRLVLRLGELGGLLRLRGSRLVGLRGLFRIGFRRRRRKLGVRGTH